MEGKRTMTNGKKSLGKHAFVAKLERVGDKTVIHQTSQHIRPQIVMK